MDCGTHSHNIPQWRSRLKTSYILKIDDADVFIESDMYEALVKVRDKEHKVPIFTKEAAANSLKRTGLSQLHFQQLKVKS